MCNPHNATSFLYQAVLSLPILIKPLVRGQEQSFTKVGCTFDQPTSRTLTSDKQTNVKSTSVDAEALTHVDMFKPSFYAPNETSYASNPAGV